MAGFASPVAVSFAPSYGKKSYVECLALSSVNVLLRLSLVYEEYPEIKLNLIESLQIIICSFD
jgi:hypothetical protein